MYVTKSKNKKIDRATAIIGICMPIITLPQLYSIWKADSLQGVSLVTWAFFTLQAGTFAIFGIKHKEKPLIITYVPLFIVELGIVIGILVKQGWPLQ